MKKKKSKPLTYEEAISLIPEMMKLTKGLISKEKEEQIKLAYLADINTMYTN